MDLKKFLIPLYPLTNIEMQKYYQHEPRFNRVYSRDNLSRNIKHGTLINSQMLELIGLLCMH